MCDGFDLVSRAQQLACYLLGALADQIVIVLVVVQRVKVGLPDHSLAYIEEDLAEFQD